MLTSSQIKSLATKLQTTEYNITTEYSQHLFLSHLYKLNCSENLLFKGGTSLRIIFESPRFSEDLDFTGINLSSKNIENLILESLNNISYAGIEVNLEEAKKTSGGYLSKIHFNWLGYSSSIQIEISLRKQSAEKEVFVISSFPCFSLSGISAFFRSDEESREFPPSTKNFSFSANITAQFIDYYRYYNPNNS